MRNVELESPKDGNLERQKAQARRYQNVLSPDMLRVTPPNSQQSERNLSSIQRARKFRNGSKRSQREIIEQIFTVLKDGETKSVARIARDSDTAWTSTYWSLDLIEFIQSQPHLSRDPDPKRKRFYRLLAPGVRKRAITLRDA